MSSGRSSQLSACFSVERTKYLMLAKSMPDRSAPQSGIGFFSKMRRPLNRCSSIHAGSFFFAEMSRTTSSFRPRRADAPATSESDQPNLYRPSWSSSGRSIVVMRDRGQPLHMRAQQSAEHLGLGLAQLREIGGHMRDRAMVLAHLHARAG